MSTQEPTPLPPTTILTSTPIPQSTAHDFLAAYLDRAATDPALQPNAGISEHGPVSRTTAAAPNIILHNLKRVQAGLAGEVLGRDLAIAEMKKGAKQAQALAQAQGGIGGVEAGWEDKKQFEQEQGMENDEVNVRSGEEVTGMDVDGVDGQGEGETGTLDKEERKRLKKERRKAEKKAKLKGEDE
ncbi:uncharacterized protein BDV17DRAFT_292807 [Aspergillus undulatus]|uniref:uncharacterized protein n=1 Tax=Aspergillus undulatus TaxID=1810928 RepID=UPI003CCD98F4